MRNEKEEARKIIARIRSSVWDGYATKKQIYRLENILILYFNNEWKRFVCWLTGYKIDDLPKVWSNRIICWSYERSFHEQIERDKRYWVDNSLT